MAGNAALYIADPSLMGSRLFDKLEGVRSYESISAGGSATGVRFTLDAGQVTMNFMPGERVAHHLKVFAGFAQQVINDNDRLVYVQSRIHYARLVCGCVITPDFDSNGTIEDFLFQFTSATNGLLLLADTIFDYDGEALGGHHAVEAK